MRFANAQQIAGILNELVDDARVAPLPRSNMLVVLAAPAVMADLAEVVEALDANVRETPDHDTKRGTE